MNFTLKQLKTFQVVAEHLNYHRAAEALFITQPAVTRQIQMLEETVGFTLFEKFGKKIQLSEQGKSMLLEVDAVMGQLDVMQTHIKQNISRDKQFSLAVIPGLEDLTMEAVIDFFNVDPDVKVSIEVISNRNMAEVIGSNKFDLCIAANSKVDSDYRSEVLFSTDLCLAACFDHPLRGKKKVTKTDIENECFIEMETSESFRETMEAFKSRYIAEENSRIKIHGRNALLKAVYAGIGIALLPRYTLKEGIESDRLCILNIDDLKLSAKYRYFFHKNKVFSEETKQFLAILRNKIGEKV
ncbi:LysR family transcriptional regulator [Vibrio marisflavi]|uniref:HTH-type transcriptional activator CmpR n=1 Tax=Vibrio marisflavi CECT 7928 TaxID=634439 RepID=A0ABN8E8M1_9VIBR|nr:LysR family transcriptional regulator [Vibrio marisflavi]CAH0541046.1 HTH-type transcriptional activator CmpR [Vibrio marisflavi CECT 7928]